MKIALSFLILFTLVGCANPRPSAKESKITGEKNHIQTIQEVANESNAEPVILGDSEIEDQNSFPKKASSKVQNISEKKANKAPWIRDDFETDSKLWTLLSEKDGIKAYRETHPAEDIVSFRGETVLHTSIEKLAAVLNTPELRKEWVDALADTHTVERTSMLDRIEYVRSKVPWPFQDRDFVFRVQVQVAHYPYSIFIKMNSVDDRREPPHPGVVRGRLLHAYYFLSDASTLQAQATKVVVEIAADPKGSIPAWIVNLTQKNWPNNTLHSLERVSIRENLFIAPEIKEFFNGLASTI